MKKTTSILLQQIDELATKLSLARDTIIAETALGLGHPVLTLTAYDLDAPMPPEALSQLKAFASSPLPN